MRAVWLAACVVFVACDRRDDVSRLHTGPSPNITATMEHVQVAGKRVATLDGGWLRDADRQRRFQIDKVQRALECTSIGHVWINVPHELPFETLFGLLFSSARTECFRHVTVNITNRALRLQHEFPRTKDGVKVDGEQYGGALGLTLYVGDDRAKLVVENADESGLDDIEWPLTDAAAARLRAHLRALVTKRWPDGAQRTAVDRRIVIDAPATAASGDVMRLVEVITADADGTELFPERSFAAPNLRTKHAAKPLPPAPAPADPANVTVTVMSDPVGATVFIGDTQMASTPTRVLMRRDQLPRELRLELAGYKHCVVTVDVAKTDVECKLAKAGPAVQ